jgi:cobyrinic acid a,c-diamide synthase
MIKLMLAAPASGSGKTAVTCALLAALQKRGLSPCAFKCGPDYIDPMFHRSALGVESHNLDLFLSGEDDARRLFATHSAGHGAAVCEGVMGFYDGLGGTTTTASAWHVADTLSLPVILVLRPKGQSLTLAAVTKGLCEFRTPSHIAGILLNDCSAMLYKTLRPMLEQELGLPVLGFLPHTEDAVIESRHLGLYTAGEIEDISARIGRLADVLEENADLDRLIALCTSPDGEAAVSAAKQSAPRAAIAVAHDEAFCFTYAETLRAFEDAGARLVFFSPLHDAALPDGVGGLYLPGGYPELYAEALSKNEPMRRAIHDAVTGGLPTVAECGGFLYLCRTLEDADGSVWQMAGVLPGDGVKTAKLVRFGYSSLTPDADSLLFRAGEKIPVHEFHYWDTTANGEAFLSEKPLTGRHWRCGFASDTLYAAFPHLYFAGHPALAARFVDAAALKGTKQL